MADITPNDLAALQDFPDYPFADIPISSDPIPYKHLQAKGRYHGHSIPNTIPPFLSILSASDTQFNPELLSTDGKRNLNVNVVNQSASGNTGLNPSVITGGEVNTGGLWPNGVIFAVFADLDMTKVIKYINLTAWVDTDNFNLKQLNIINFFFQSHIVGPTLSIGSIFTSYDPTLGIIGTSGPLLFEPAGGIDIRDFFAGKGNVDLNALSFGPHSVQSYVSGGLLYAG